MAIQLIRCKSQSLSFSSFNSDLPHIPTWFDDNYGPSEEKVARNELIVSYFQEDCARRGKACFVLFFPDIRELMNMNEAGVNVMELIYAGFPDSITVWDPTAFLLDHVAAGDTCDLFAGSGECTGHYNAHGNELIACFVAQQLASAQGSLSAGDC